MTGGRIQGHQPSSEHWSWPSVPSSRVLRHAVRSLCAPLILAAAVALVAGCGAPAAKAGARPPARSAATPTSATPAASVLSQLPVPVGAVVSTQDIQDPYFVSLSDGYALDANPDSGTTVDGGVVRGVAATTNGGTTWRAVATAAELPKPAGSVGPVFTNPDDGVLASLPTNPTSGATVGGSDLERTSDGGRTWSVVARITGVAGVGADTLYVVAPAHHHAQLAPIIVCLLDQVRHHTYTRPVGSVPVVWALDEVANIAPLPDLPAIIAEGASQGLITLACLQDLHQARARWGQQADGFLTLFAAKLALPGIADRSTLQQLSYLAGSYDHTYRTHSGSGIPGGWSESVQQRPLIPPERISHLPPGWALIAHTNHPPHYIQLLPPHPPAPPTPRRPRRQPLRALKTQLVASWNRENQGGNP